MKKTKSIIRNAAYDSGAVCFETSFGTITDLSFYGDINETTASITVAENKWFAENIGKSTATALVASTDLALNTFFNGVGRSWYHDTNHMKGIFNYFPYYSLTGTENGSYSSW